MALALRQLNPIHKKGAIKFFFKGTLSTKDKVNLAIQLSDGFKRSVYQNNQTIPTKVKILGTNIYELLSTSFQGVKELFVLAYTIAANAANNKAGIKDNRRYFLPRGNIENYNVLMENKL